MAHQINQHSVAIGGVALISNKCNAQSTSGHLTVNKLRHQYAMHAGQPQSIKWRYKRGGLYSDDKSNINSDVKRENIKYHSRDVWRTKSSRKRGCHRIGLSPWLNDILKVSASVSKINAWRSGGVSIKRIMAVAAHKYMAYQ